MQRLQLAILTLLMTIALGVVGYMLVERWSAFDALYMTVITLATVGYGETHPLSPSGRVFTMALITVGRIAEVFVVVTFTQLLVVEQLSGVLARRRMQREVGRLEDHFIICGWGRMGQEIVEQLRAKHARVVVIELNPDKARRLIEQRVMVVQGDAADDATLKTAGIERARALIAVAPGDADNIFITLSARAINPDLFIVARCAYEQDIQKLRTAGANRVISPYVIGARRIAAAATHPNVVDFLDQEVHREDMEWELEDIPVTHHAVFAGKSLRDSRIREETGCTVLAIKEAATQQFHSNPPPEAVLQVGDTLIALGNPNQLERLEELSGLGTEQKAFRRRSLRRDGVD